MSSDVDLPSTLQSLNQPLNQSLYQLPTQLTFQPSNQPPTQLTSNIPGYNPNINTLPYSHHPTPTPTPPRTNYNTRYIKQTSHTIFWVILIIAIILTTLFLILYLVILFKTKETIDKTLHQIYVTNKTQKPCTAYIGYQDIILFSIPLNTFSSNATFQADPGSQFWVKFQQNTNVVSQESINYSTQAMIKILKSADNEYPQLYYKNNSYRTAGYDNNHTNFGVSIVDGYNGMIVISASGTNLENVITPNWGNAITPSDCNQIGTSIGNNTCFPNNKDCQVCLSACSACVAGGGCNKNNKNNESDGKDGKDGKNYCCVNGCGDGKVKCQDTWGDITIDGKKIGLYDYYSGVCDGCMITKCDTGIMLNDSADNFVRFEVSYLG